MKLSSISPAALDAWAKDKRGLPAGVWRLLRAALLDRALYWGVALTVVLPALFGYFGGGFDVQFDLLGKIAFSLGFWFWALAASAICGFATILLIGRERSALLRNTQRALFCFNSGLALWLAERWFDTALSFSTAGLVAAVAVITLLAEWSIGDGPCKDGACELPKPRQ